jgi:DNA-binding winged helix-turn-helix (wHTH) protein
MSESRDSSSPGHPHAGVTPPDRFRFGSFTLDLRARKLWRDSVLIPLPARAVDALVYLIAHRDRPVDKDEIIAAVWRDVAVTDDSLIHSVSVIRRALGDDPTHPSYIETIPRRGYRFVGSVEFVDPAREPASAAEQPGESPTAIAPESVHPVRWMRRRAIAAAALLLMAAAIPSYRGYLGRNASTDAAIRVEQVAPPGTTIVSGGIVSPSGRHLAFVARDERSGKTALWVRALDSPQPRMLPGTEGASKPFFSPDGQVIAFFLKGT